VSIIQSKSGGKVVGRCKVVNKKISHKTQYLELKRRHLVDLNILKTIVPSFKNFTQTPVVAWELKDVVKYEDDEIWYYTGNLRGNPIWRELAHEHMSFLQAPQAPPKSRRIQGKRKPSEVLVPPEVKKPRLDPEEQVALSPKKKPRTEIPEGVECKKGCCCQKCRNIKVNGLTFSQRRQRKGRSQKHGQQRGRPKKESKIQDPDEGIESKWKDDFLKPPPGPKKKKWTRKSNPPDDPDPKSKKKRKKDVDGKRVTLCIYTKVQHINNYRKYLGEEKPFKCFMEKEPWTTGRSESLVVFLMRVSAVCCA